MTAHSTKDFKNSRALQTSRTDFLQQWNGISENYDDWSSSFVFLSSPVTCTELYNKHGARGYQGACCRGCNWAITAAAAAD